MTVFRNTDNRDGLELLFMVNAKARSRQVIVPVWTRSRSIKHVADAGLVPNELGIPRRVCIANSAPTCLYGPTRNNYPSEAELYIGRE